MHHSEFAAKLVCRHCGQPNRSEEWPLDGDRTALYYQDEPGSYQVVVHCPHCGEDWYVVWDQDPGPIRRLDSVAEALGPDEALVTNDFELYSGEAEIPAGTLGIVKKAYPGGAVVVEFPSLGIEGQWTDDVFTAATAAEAERLRDTDRREAPGEDPESRVAEPGEEPAETSDDPVCPTCRTVYNRHEVERQLSGRSLRQEGHG